MGGGITCLGALWGWASTALPPAPPSELCLYSNPPNVVGGTVCLPRDGGFNKVCRRFWLSPRGKACLWQLVVKARDAGRHPTTRGTAPQGRFHRPEGHWFQDRVSSVSSVSPPRPPQLGCALESDVRRETLCCGCFLVLDRRGGAVFIQLRWCGFGALGLLCESLHCPLPRWRGRLPVVPRVSALQQVTLLPQGGLVSWAEGLRSKGLCDTVHRSPAVPAGGSSEV